MLATETQERSRAEQIHVRKPVAQLAQQPLGRCLIGSGGDDRDQVTERRVAELPAARELLGEKARDIVPRRKNERARVGLKGLDEHPPRSVPAASAGELGDELEGALLRPEVGEPEAGVRIHDRGERDAGEMVALRDHLGSDEDDAIAGGKALERLLVRAALRRRVGIEPDPLELGHVLLELPFQPLRPRADPGQLERAARGTAPGLGLGEATVVAVETAVAVHGERDVAALAPARHPTRAAVQGGHEAAPVEEEDRLAAALGDLPRAARSGAESG